MQFGSYKFSCKIASQTILPPYKGSTFRGAFGSAMKSVVCALKQRDCGQCILAASCIYALTFEFNNAAAGRHNRTATAPHPYVIEPPLTTRTSFKEGDSFDFHLLLCGETNQHLPYFIYAFKAMGERGLGKRINGQRGAYELLSVSKGNTTIYDRTEQSLATCTPAILDVAAAGESGASELDLLLTTPLRLKFASNLRAELPFHLLVRALLRRISSLFACYGDGEPDLDYRGLVRRAEDIEIISDKLRWYDWQRYSNRQEKSMLMGGMLGSATYCGDFSKFIPLLELGKILHIGKQTSFGLGLFDYTLRAKT